MVVGSALARFLFGVPRGKERKEEALSSFPALRKRKKESTYDDALFYASTEKRTLFLGLNLLALVNRGLFSCGIVDFCKMGPCLIEGCLHADFPCSDEK